MADCDRKLKAAVKALTFKASGPGTPLPKARLKDKQVNAPLFDVRAALHGVLVTDLTQVDPWAWAVSVATVDCRVRH